MKNPLVLREALRYIPKHRGSTFVIEVSGELVEGGFFVNTAIDITLLQNLGIKPVIVHGARQQIEARLKSAGHKVKRVKGVWVTDPTLMEIVKQAYTLATLEVTTKLSSVSQTTSNIKTFTGNVIRAKRKGVIDGTDYQFTGEVDYVDVETLSKVLTAGLVPVISPLAIDSQGEILNLIADEVATEIAIRLGAQKLIFLTNVDGLFAHGELLRQLTLEEITDLVERKDLISGDILAKTREGIKACRAGVPRIHFINGKRDGSLLLEIFSRDGLGTMIHSDIYSNIRPASLSDVPRMVAMAEKPIEEGRLIGRPVKELQETIEEFVIYEKDEQVIGCCRLTIWPEEESSEISYLVVDENYRHQGIATQLVEYQEGSSKRQGLQTIFALTARAESWFLNRDFKEGDPDILPSERRQTYNHIRNSKVMVKNL